MINYYELDNGLKIYLLPDKNKHTVYANLIVRFGGGTTDIIKEGKHLSIKCGTAHFLEHLVLECSKYGDIMSKFGSEGINSNGITSINSTHFYIDTVDRLEENLKLLLLGVHNPVINKKNIEKIRGPILAEKRRSLDNKYTELHNLSFKSVFNKNFDSILGGLDKIELIDEKDLELAFKTFYIPSNEIIVISGNFDSTKVLDLIKKIYNKLKISDNDAVTYIPKSRIKKYTHIKDNINIENSLITFKLNMEDVTPIDRLITDTYIYFFLKETFGEGSYINKKLTKNNIIIGNIMSSNTFIDDHLYIKIEADVKDSKAFYKTIISTLEEKKYNLDEHVFNLYKKNYLLDVILKKDNIYFTTDSLIDHIIEYNYDNLESIEMIENMNFNEYSKNIN